jgi:hypothetical protein
MPGEKKKNRLQLADDWGESAMRWRPGWFSEQLIDFSDF